MASSNEPPRGARPSGPAPKAPPPRSRRPKSGRSSGSLIGLGSAAIVAIYGAGYLSTRSDAAAATDTALSVLPSVTATATPTPFLPVNPRRSDDGGIRRGRDQAPLPSATLAPAQPPAAAAVHAGFRDGTYTGAGNSRHGGIEATVVIQGGRIVSANISNCGTRYPCSRVESLVSQVVAKQAVPVNYVSGATDSSTAYRQAVAAALAKASQA